ncbi:transport and Golgi organization protein 1 homolog [Conger conger]|uniref:transport and Golgi organization protein 1 homolog n=1 Tax=Conger conger TaxID=82655 RepID=UPI002A59BBDE|nr:transport and Golgi organization protein 1 homolog [Conger conger]
MPGPFDLGPDFYGLPWNVLLIMVVINIMIMTFAWRRMSTLKRALSRMTEDGNQQLEMKLAKVLQLEGTIKLLEQEKVVLQNDNIHLELQLKLCQDPDSTPQTLESEDHDKESEVKDEMKSQKPNTMETEQEHKNTNGRIKIQMEFHKKQAEEYLMSTHIAEHALAAERKENAILRQNIIKVSSELAEIKTPVIVPPLRKDCAASGTSVALECKQCMEKLQEEKRKTMQMEETIKNMECDQTNLQNLHKILQEKLQIMHNLCKEKDSAQQQSLAQEQIEQHVKEIKSAGPKQEIRNFKLRLQEINEKNERTQNGLKKQIVFHQKKAQENWVVACASERALTIKRKEMAKLSKKLSEVSAKTQAKSADQFEQSRCPAELAAEKLKVQQLEEIIKAMEEDHKTLKKEIFKMELQNKSFQRKLENMNELCKQKDHALQKKATQVDSERRDKELKVKEVLKTHKLKIKAITEQHQKSELSYKAEIVSLKKSRDKLAQVKLACAAEEAQHIYRQKLQLEKKMSQQLGEKIKTLEQDRDALKGEKCQLEDQITALRSQLQNMSELCQQKVQALQQNMVQVDMAQRVQDAEMEALASKIKMMEEELEKSQCIKARIEDLEAERNTIIALQNQMAEAMAEFQQTTSEVSSGYSYEALPLQSDSKDIPLLSQTEVCDLEISTPSSSGRTHLVRASQSLIEVKDVQPTQKPRRSSVASVEHHQQP